MMGEEGYVDKRTLEEKIHDIVGNWLRWAVYTIAIKEGDRFWAALEEAVKDDEDDDDE